MNLNTEKRILQYAVALACCVPIGAGLLGIVTGTAFFGGSTLDLDNHFRYLSGLLLGIGVAFLRMIPHLERHTQPVRILTAIVVIGGLGRAYGMWAAGVPNLTMQLALGMELVVTPILCLWQGRIARRFSEK